MLGLLTAVFASYVSASDSVWNLYDVKEINYFMVDEDPKRR